MSLRTICLLALVGTSLLLGDTSDAKKKSPEEVCAGYKPDRTLSSDSSSASAASVSGKSVIGVSGAASGEHAQAEKREQQALPEEELKRQNTLYLACISYENGGLSKDAWEKVQADALGLNTAPPPAAVVAPAGPAKPKVHGVQLTPGAKPCGRFGGFNIHVPKRYTKKLCKDEAGSKSRYVFTSTLAKGATCQAMSQWALQNGFKQASQSKTPGKDEMVFKRAGAPDLTIKCINATKESGKPTRLVFLLPQL